MGELKQFLNIKERGATTVTRATSYQTLSTTIFNEINFIRLSTQINRIWNLPQGNQHLSLTKGRHYQNTIINIHNIVASIISSPPTPPPQPTVATYVLSWPLSSPPPPSSSSSSSSLYHQPPLPHNLSHATSSEIQSLRLSSPPKYHGTCTRFWQTVWITSSNICNGKLKVSRTKID